MLVVNPQTVQANNVADLTNLLRAQPGTSAYAQLLDSRDAALQDLSENLNYKAETLMEHWPKRFPTMDIANQYARNPKKIANMVYANRMGNRDEASGDGYRFRGRGCIQLTGHDSYFHCGQALGVDFVANPDLVASPKYAALSAGWFWATHKCNDLAQVQDWVKLTKVINGGTIGLDDRILHTNQALAVLTS